jgi:hypothetical protein
MRAANVVGAAVTGLLLAIAAPAAALPMAMPSPVVATLESIVRDWGTLYARTPQSLQVPNADETMREFVARTRQELAAVDQAMQALGAADRAEAALRKDALAQVEPQLVARFDAIMKLQLDLAKIEEPYQRAATLGLRKDTTLDDLPPEIARVSWLVRDPRHAGAWRVLLRLEQNGGDDRTRAIALASELEEARRERAIVAHTKRGDELAAARASGDRRIAAAVKAVEDAGIAATGSGPNTTPTPLPPPIPDTSRMRGHIHLVREALKSALHNLTLARTALP